LEEIPHYFQQVPFVEFRLNEEKDSIFDKIISLQDAYNELLSSEVDDFQAFTDAYLVLKGCGIAEEDAAQMRENRILMLDSEDSAEYLTKNISDTQIENMLSNINDSIHVIANSPDFNDEKFMATSGIAMRYKLVGFENTSSAIAANMTKALQRRIELLYTVIGLIAGDKFKDVQIKFTRNLPLDNTEIINTINSLRGMLSDRTLIGLLPFVSDVDAELEAIQTQKVLNMEMYNFGGEDTTKEENE
jgi:SPP1 family phage portal protein